jgi:hypothetical protein
VSSRKPNLSDRRSLAFIPDLPLKYPVLDKSDNRCIAAMRDESNAHKVVAEVHDHLSRNSFLSAMKALDLLTADYQLQYYSYILNDEIIGRRVLTPSQTLIEFVKHENESAKQLDELRKSARKAIITSRTLSFGFQAAAMGFVVGFFRGCTLRTFSMDGGTWLGTLIVFALLGALLGLIVGVSTEPKKGY